MRTAGLNDKPRNRRTNYPFIPIYLLPSVRIPENGTHLPQLLFLCAPNFLQLSLKETNSRKMREKEREREALRSP